MSREGDEERNEFRLFTWDVILNENLLSDFGLNNAASFLSLSSSSVII